MGKRINRRPGGALVAGSVCGAAIGAQLAKTDDARFRLLSRSPGDCTSRSGRSRLRSTSHEAVGGATGRANLQYARCALGDLFHQRSLCRQRIRDAIIVPGFSGTDRDRVALEDYVGPDYFDVIGIPVLAGRGIEKQDTPTSTRVAVVNEAMVKHFYGGNDPIGRQFMIDDAAELSRPITIIGISRNAKDHGSGIREDVRPRFYLAFQQVTDPAQIMLEAQAGGAPSAAVSNLQSEIKAADPHLPIGFVETLDTLVTDSAGEQIALAKLSAFFGALALLLACIGLYGVMSYTVAGRTREIGVRMALGAQRLDVLRLVLREAMLLVVIGLAIGIPLSLASTRFLHSYLFGLKGTDPASLIAVVVVLGIVAASAASIPARRAASVDPMTALRYE